MNSILQLKGKFTHRGNTSKPGSPKLPKGAVVFSSEIQALKSQLENILRYWEGNNDIGGALVSVHYKHVVAKSNRLHTLLSYTGHKPVDSIRGAKFEWSPKQDGTYTQKHVFTHYVPLEALRKAIQTLSIVLCIVDSHYNGQISNIDTDKIVESKIFRYKNDIAPTTFLAAILDCWYVQNFDIDKISEEIKEESIITIYKTDIDTKALMSKFGISVFNDRILDETTLRLRPDEIQLLVDQAPYLISMSVTDWNQITRDDILDSISDELNECDRLIKAPSNEPLVGVIDTQFDENVYFHEWVDYKNMLDSNIPLQPKDFEHGTAVTSIIVDGPRGNPGLDDGCGNFRVRHFGVATGGAFSSFSILRNIRNIIASNRDIKVWNLSLGSQLEIKNSSISPEAAELDKIQSDYDVIFIVAGTNLPLNKKNQSMKIGAPADSLNSLVVNAVNFDRKPASYTRVGPVLSFFYKPDISYYGGDGSKASQKIVVCKDSCGASYVSGTSFAAPWITRKMAYLIHVMGLSKEVAKALIIDSAAGWNSQDDCSHSIGYGVVPINIQDILHTPDDEIRFILSGTSDSYETYTYNLPVPVVNNAHPFYARATLAYFPHCNRNQGVDYTNTEMDIHFGRIKMNGYKPEIKAIDDNKQGNDGLMRIYEEDARAQYRKWDNVKHICETIKTRPVPRKAYEAGMWGLSIKTKERLTNKRQDRLPFGVVITLKEMNGVNRIDDFIKLCMAREWLVNRIDVDNQVTLYAQAEEDISFD